MLTVAYIVYATAHASTSPTRYIAVQSASGETLLVPTTSAAAVGSDKKPIIAKRKL